MIIKYEEEGSPFQQGFRRRRCR